MKLYYLLFSLALLSCNKKLLEKSPSTNLAAPATLTDCRGLMNDQFLLGEAPSMGEQSSDDYYLPYRGYLKLSLTEKNTYSWEKEIYFGQTGIPEYNLPYRQVYTANLVLETLYMIEPVTGTRQTWFETRGCALFIRAYALYNISQVFAAVYDANSPNPGIVLPLTTDQNVIYERSSMKETYEQIINDLSEAAKLLPVKFTGNDKHLPGQTAVYALLARIYLSMRLYDKALLYADSSLQQHDELIDFNTIDIQERHPIAGFNTETIYNSWLMSSNSFLMAKLNKDCIVDSSLYALYKENDLRREVFFMLNQTSKPIIRSSYTGTFFLFSGLAVDEMLLIRAECHARKKNIEAAGNDMRKLLLERYRWDTPIPSAPGSQQELIDYILTERRKELAFRGLRWSDLRRLNKEGAGISLHREINGRRYELPPNDPKYVLPLPDDALIGGRVVQNER